MTPTQVWTRTRGMRYRDGSMYVGQLDRCGKRVGYGTMRNPIYMYGVYDPNNSGAIANWMEYSGEWRNNLPNGYGIARKCRGDELGTRVTIYEGEWINGEPVNDP
jgi:hypothetical protein